MEVEVGISPFVAQKDFSKLFFYVYFRQIRSKMTKEAYFGRFLMKKAEF